jgi:dihydroorotase-like cyclic amidohydrolase
MTIRYPGLIDVHAHLRVPGGEQKEDFSSGSRAAIAGGITMLLAMPNTTPPLTNRTELEKAQKLAKEKALCEVLFFAGVSPETIHQLPAISYQAVALKIYMDHTFGPLLVQDPGDLAKCFEKYSPGKPIAVHAEGESVATAIGLADHYQRSVHICHVSRKEEIRMVRNAKDAGIRVT